MGRPISEALSSMVGQRAASPPTLPVVRQPSPLSFSVTSDDHSQTGSPARSSSSLPVPTVQPGEAGPSRIRRTPSPTPLPTTNRQGNDGGSVPITPLPDSILYRSTLTHLESSSSTLKRLSKSVLAHSSVLIAALEAVEKAEEDFLAILGELSRFLEGGFGVPSGIWAEDGIRKVRKEKWKSQREEVRGMVEVGVVGMKGDLKRWGLAGGGAQAKFDRTSKIYYDQTSNYLSHSDPSSSPASHSMSATTSAPSHSRQSSPSASEIEQSARTATFELARYSHHSTYLYAVPPSSLSCLDLLVNLYGWVGGALGDNPIRRESTGGMEEAFGSTPSLISQPKSIVSPSVKLKDDVAIALSRLGGVRVELLDGWAKRNLQTAKLEDEANRLVILSETKSDHKPTSPLVPYPINSTPISSSGVEYKKANAGRMHKLHRSVGGKLRDLLSSSGSTKDLAGLAGRNAQIGDKSARNSFDVSMLGGKRGELLRQLSEIDDEDEEPEEEIRGPTIKAVPSPGSGEGGSKRPSLQNRHSIQVVPDSTPFLVDPTLFPLPIIAPEARIAAISPASQSVDSVLPPPPVFIDVGEAMEQDRDDVGRKKEGVLWGAGTWEEVGKGGKVRWEKYWVVLDHSSIYEYRDTDFDRPEGPHAIIDLKFASVREGRGTDRRFVFEIVTPTQGRRLYQATSEAEMKQWIYSICNAIESVIQGTSSVRTFDTSKLRTISGAYDDHAVPLRQKLGFPIPGIPPRAGGMPSIPGSPSRRSMPPPSKVDEGGPGLFDQRPRKRQTSFKKALRQSAEIAGEKWKDAINPRYPTGGGNTGFLSPGGRIKSSSSQSGLSVSSGGWRTDSPPPLPSNDGSHDNHHLDTNTKPQHTGQTLVDDTWDPDGEIEKRVMEMAGLGLGFSPSASPDGRRIQSEGKGILGGSPGRLVLLGEDITRSRSADLALPPVKLKPQRLDMEVLRKVAASPRNAVCADCGKSTKSSRWATISLRDTPMVLFICIRCCGIHRSFGTHISKPRSVDLDIWTQESIALAVEWGNERGNEIWEAIMPDQVRPRGDEDIADFVRRKYVDGVWLSDEMRARYRLEPREGVMVGVALGEPLRPGAQAGRVALGAR